MSENLRQATDNDYNAPSREIIGKVAMYLDGNAAEPLELNTSDYLIDYGLMEEASADSSTPFGNVTANELTITIYNENGLFSPTNTESPFYGKMRLGVKVIPYIRTTETEYEELGTFYVNDWNATVTGISAVVTAADKLYDMLNTPIPAIPVVRNTTFRAFIQQVFSILNAPVQIEDGFDNELIMSYNIEALSKLLTSISVGSLATCFCDHSGVIKFRSLVTNCEVRAVLTDADQIINIDANLGLTSGYNGAAVTYNTPQESADTEVLTVNDLVVPIGDTFLPSLILSTKPMIRLLSASLTSKVSIPLIDINADSISVSVRTDNRSDSKQTASLSVIGTTVETVATTIGDTDSNLLDIDNIYIQDSDYANYYLGILRRFVDNAIPILIVDVRGNPLLNILDKITVRSTKYKVDFTGLILRNELRYNGALSSTLTLLNTDILEV